MSEVKQEYLKNINNEIISPIVSASSVLFGDESLSNKLGMEKVSVGYCNNTQEYSVDLDVLGDVFILVTRHRSHGSCGSLHFIARGQDTGSTLTTLVNSTHAQVSLEQTKPTGDYNKTILKVKGDTWGAHCTLYRIN